MPVSALRLRALRSLAPERTLIVMPPAAPQIPRGSDNLRGQRIYPNPPVIEATIDIHVAKRQDLRLNELAALYIGEEDRYPIFEPQLAGTFSVDPGTGAVLESKRAILGYRFTSQGSSQIVQARTEGFTFSHLQPYETWENWNREAARLWSRYVAISRPTAVTRLAVRYINRIEFVPSAGSRLEDYLRVYPTVPDGLQSDLANLLMRLELKPKDLPESTLIVSVGRTEPTQAGRIAFLLDIDVSRSVAIEPRNDGIWPLIDQLHEKENAFFETCITDVSRSLFD